MIPTLHFRWNLVPKDGPGIYQATLQQLWVDSDVFAHGELALLEEAVKVGGIKTEWRDIPKNYA